jgi:hypothetical protein
MGRKISVVFPFILIISFILLPVSSPAFQNEPDGFGGIAWGTNVSTLSGMVYDSQYTWAAGTTSFYRRKGDTLRFGEAQLLSLRYGFFEGNFSDVLTETRGRKNWVALKRACFEKYGQAFKENYYIENYRWSGKITSIVLEYKESEDLSTLLMKSEVIYEQIKSKLRQKAE